MGRLLSRIVHLLYSVFAGFIPIRKNRVTLICRGYNGSNVVALHRMYEEVSWKDFDVMLLFPERFRGLRGNLELTARLASSAVVVTTHGPLRLKQKQYCIELWHGFPIKGMLKMDRSLSSSLKRRLATHWSRVDLIASYSSLYTTVMNACIGIDINKYRITGMPRNDFLLKSNGRERLSAILGRVIKEKRVILFLPTYRKGYAGKTDGNKYLQNIFGFRFFNWDCFVSFLKRNDCHFLYKMHPNEERFLQNALDTPRDSRITFLSGQIFNDRAIDFYEILNAVDVLLTDYSSVYFDFLLINRPIVFIPIDIAEYRANRGFLLEPFDFWTPGPKVIDQIGLETEIEKCFKDAEYFRHEREMIGQVIHAHEDSSSSERIWRLIGEILNLERYGSARRKT